MKIVRTLGHLAAACGTSRQTLGGWLKLDGNPGRRADGSFSVSRWQKWVAESGLGSRAASADRDPRLDPLKREKLRLQSKKLALETEGATLQNAVSRGELESEMTACHVILDPYRDFIQELKGVKHRVGHIVSGQTSGEATRILSKELTACIARWQLPEVYRNHPFYGKLKAELARLNAELVEEGGV